MRYYEAIGNAIMKIGTRVRKPVRLVCNLKEKSVDVYAKVEGKWVLMERVLEFDDVSYLEVEQLILGALEDDTE